MLNHPFAFWNVPNCPCFLRRAPPTFPVLLFGSCPSAFFAHCSLVQALLPIFCYLGGFFIFNLSCPCCFLGLAHLSNLLSGCFPPAHFAVWVLALLPHLLISLFVACKIARFELLFVTILGHICAIYFFGSHSIAHVACWVCPSCLVCCNSCPCSLRVHIDEDLATQP